MTQIKTRIIDLNFLSETISQMNKAKDFQSISEIIFNFIEELVVFDMAVIYRVNETQKELEIVSCRGSDTQKMKNRVPFKIGEGAVGWVAREKKALLINDVLESEYIQVRQFSHEDPIIRSFLAVPMIVGNKLIGILSVSCSKPHQYEEYDVEMITIIASQGATLLQLNNEVNETKRFSNHVLENINSGVIVIDSDYKIFIFNKAAEKISGYSSEEAIGQSILKLPLKEDQSHWYIVESLESGKVFFENPGYMIRKDGKYVNLRLSTSLMRNEDGSIKGCICIFRDNTEIEKLQQQIMRAEKLAAIGRLTAGITHEIRNPLLPIRTASNFLLSKIQKEGINQESIKLLNIIKEESERLNKFLDQFVNLNKESLDITGHTLLKEVIEETVILLKHDLKKHKIYLQENYPALELYVPYSKDKLKQVFLNLFINSIDALNSIEEKRKKKISVEVENDDRDVIVRLRDTGCGISKENLNNIFDPFYTTKENGTGLGLPIIHNIITSVGGEISVESNAKEGTLVTITMPLAEMEGE